MLDNNQISALKFNYGKDGRISTVRVSFTEEPEDDVTIRKEYINELRNYMNVTERDKEYFYIIARAIQLKKEYTSSRVKSGRSSYNFGTKLSPFHQRFIEKLVAVSAMTTLDSIVNFFSDELKMEGLDLFLNKMDCYQLALYLQNGGGNYNLNNGVNTYAHVSRYYSNEDNYDDESSC